MKPYVVCHMCTTVDGRIKPRAGLSKGMGQLFETYHEKVKGDCWIVGRTTMQGFASKTKHKAKATKVPKGDFVGEHESKTYAVVLDPSGKCQWDKNMTDSEHVIEVLTERVPKSYLAHLREKQVSYIFAGKNEIDIHLVLRKLNKLFKIKRALLEGGGIVNGSFLKAGVIDELSLLIMPIADGATDMPTVFDSLGEPGPPAKLKLKSVKRIRGGTLWARYLF